MIFIYFATWRLCVRPVFFWFSLPVFIHEDPYLRTFKIPYSDSLSFLLLIGSLRKWFLSKFT